MTFKRHGFAVLLLFAVQALSNWSLAASQSSDLHAAEQYLNSISSRVGVYAPRLHVAASKTFIAHPSYLQRWGIVAADAAAAYNDWLNTLILQPEMTIADNAGDLRIRTLLEIHQATGSASSTAAATIFHELAHAEWDLFVEEGETATDRELLATLTELLPALNAGFFERRILPSEIFAYYRGDLLGMILSDANEILLASGLEPDTLGCITRARPTEVLRNFSPSPKPYSERHQLTAVWVQGEEISVVSGIDPHGKKLNDALFKHLHETMQFPKSRVELLKLLESKPNLRKKVRECAAPRT
jgi:hypothetical protein